MYYVTNGLYFVYVVKQAYQLDYWQKHKDSFMLNEGLKQFVTEIFEEVAQKGIRNTITKKNLQQCYNKCINVN